MNASIRRLLPAGSAGPLRLPALLARGRGGAIAFVLAASATALPAAKAQESAAVRPPAEATHSAPQGDAAAPLPDSPLAVHPILTGARIPDVMLETEAGKPFDLLLAAAEKPTLLVFFRGSW